MSPLGGLHGGQRPVHELLRRVVVTRQVEGHERGAPVGGELPLVALGVRALDLLDALLGVDALHHVRHGGPERRVVLPRAVLALDEDRLPGLVGEGLAGDLVETARLADAGVVVLQRVGSDRAADEDGENHEHEPSDDGLLPVLGAPAAGSRCQVWLVVHRSPFHVDCHTTSLSSGGRASNAAATRAWVRLTPQHRCCRIGHARRVRIAPCVRPAPAVPPSSWPPAWPR